MAPRGRKALTDVTNMAGNKEVTTLKSQIKQKDDENEQLRAQLAELTAALEKTSITEQKPVATVPRNPFGPSMTPAALVPAPLPPKRGTSAYIFFMKHVRNSGTHAVEFAGKTPQEVTAAIGQKWKDMSEELRAPFDEMAEADRKRYEREMETFRVKKEEAETERKALEMHFQQQKVETALAFYEENFAKMQEKEVPTKAAKDPNAPKHARSAYLLFSSDRHAQLNATPGEKLGFKDSTKMISEEWNKLNASKKKKDVAVLAKYRKRADADKARYVQEKEAYDAEKAKENAAKEDAARAEFERTKDQALKSYNAIAQEQEKVKEAKRLAAEAEKAAKEEKRKAREEKKAEKAAKALLPKKPRSAYILFSQATRPQVVAANPDAPPTEIMKELGAMWKNAAPAVKARFEQESADDKVRYQNELAQL